MQLLSSLLLLSKLILLPPRQCMTVHVCFCDPPDLGHLCCCIWIMIMRRSFPLLLMKTGTVYITCCSWNVRCLQRLPCLNPCFPARGTTLEDYGSFWKQSLARGESSWALRFRDLAPTSLLPGCRSTVTSCLFSGRCGGLEPFLNPEWKQTFLP